MMPAIYGKSYDITQGPGFVAVRYEMVHETRVIPLESRPHAPSVLKSYIGDARGHWEGDTLVVETTNFRPRDAELLSKSGSSYGFFLDMGITNCTGSEPVLPAGIKEPNVSSSLQ